MKIIKNIKREPINMNFMWSNNRHEKSLEKLNYLVRTGRLDKNIYQLCQGLKSTQGMSNVYYNNYTIL